MKKLLFLTPELPYPGNSGGKLKSLQLLRRLMEEYEVSLACPLKLDDRHHVIRFLSEFRGLKQVLVRATDVPRTAGNLLRSYRQGVPLNVLRTANTDLAADVAEVIDGFDMVFIDHYEVAQYVPDSYQGQRIYHAHNAYHKLWQRYAERGFNVAYRSAAAIECRRVRRAEVELCERADLVFASPNDIDALVAAGAPRDTMRQTYHLGDEANLAAAPLRRAKTTLRLLYVGNLAWEPNAQGLHWFIDKVWPALKQACPKLELDIVGRNPDHKLQRMAEADESILLHGFVEDLEPLYNRARVSIAPLTFGAGMKVKVLSSLARGLPTVTTPVGAEGIAAKHGEHLLVSDNPRDMIGQVLRLLDDAVLWQRLSNESRALVQRRYTWDAMFMTMHSAMQLIGAQQRARELQPEIVSMLDRGALGAAL